MDSVTQIALGAAVGGAIAGKELGWKAFAYGAAFGTLPDLDVLVHYADAVDQVTKHRSWTHSLFVMTALTPIFAWGLRKLHGTKWVTTTLMVWLCLVTHTLLDSFTTYGTQIFWPMQSPPVSISTIFIIDLFYTLPLLTGAILGLVWLNKRPNKARKSNYIGFVLSHTYLLISVFFMLFIKDVATDTLVKQGITEEPILAPTPFNIVSWRVLAKDEQSVWIGYYSLLRPKEIEFIAYPHNKNLASVSELSALARLDWFTQGYYQLQEVEGQLKFLDLRLGIEPVLPFRYIIAQRADSPTDTKQWQAMQAIQLPQARVNDNTVNELIAIIKGQGRPSVDPLLLDKVGLE